MHCRLGFDYFAKHEETHMASIGPVAGLSGGRSLKLNKISFGAHLGPLQVGVQQLWFNPKDRHEHSLPDCAPKLCLCALPKQGSLVSTIATVKLGRWLLAAFPYAVLLEATGAGGTPSREGTSRGCKRGKWHAWYVEVAQILACPFWGHSKT